jgi:hypothetical protein
MSDLGEEVATLLKGAQDQQGPVMSWWQRAALIMGANVVAITIGGMALSGGKIVWDKALSTDEIRRQGAADKKELKEQAVEDREEFLRKLTDQKATADAQRRAMLDAIAKLSAEVNTLRKAIRTGSEGVVNNPSPPLLPFQDWDVAPDDNSQAQQQQHIPSPSADEVETTREQLQQKIDKEVFRAHAH